MYLQNKNHLSGTLSNDWEQQVVEVLGRQPHKIFKYLLT